MEANQPHRKRVRVRVKRRLVQLPPGTRRWLVGHVKELYGRHKSLAMSRQGRGTYKPNWKELNKQTNWDRIVDFFVEHGLNIDRCLWARFRLAESEAKDSVFPNTLIAEKYLKVYQQVCRTLPEELAIDLHTQRSLCRTYLLTTASQYQLGEDELRFTLLSRSLDLSPLFRYCLAVSEQLHDVARRYSRRALEQYLLARTEYDSAWAGWIPEKLSRKADQIIAGEA